MLCVSAREGHTEMVSLLLEFDADVNEECDRGMTALSYAAANGHLEIMRMLIIKKSRVRVCLDGVLNITQLFLGRIIIIISFALSKFYMKCTNL